jgi:osmotically-inducible protein OsmY
MGVARREHEAGRVTGQGAKCYHFPVRRLLLTLLAATALTASCRSFKQEVDLSDQAVNARIESVLRGRRDLDLKYVTVDVNTGVATISGIVPSGDQARIIRRLAAGVQGVDQVLNNLVIQE